MKIFYSSSFFLTISFLNWKIFYHWTLLSISNENSIFHFPFAFIFNLSLNFSRFEFLHASFSLHYDSCNYLLFVLQSQSCFIPLSFCRYPCFFYLFLPIFLYFTFFLPFFLILTLFLILTHLPFLSFLLSLFLFTSSSSPLRNPGLFAAWDGWRQRPRFNRLVPSISILLDIIFIF